MLDWCEEADMDRTFCIIMTGFYVLFFCIMRKKDMPKNASKYLKNGPTPQYYNSNDYHQVFIKSHVCRELLQKRSMKYVVRALCWNVRHLG